MAWYNRENPGVQKVLREPEDEVMTAPITIDELDANLEELKTKKAPGPDNVPNDLLINLGPQAKKKTAWNF